MKTIFTLLLVACCALVGCERKAVSADASGKNPAAFESGSRPPVVLQKSGNVKVQSQGMSHVVEAPRPAPKQAVMINGEQAEASLPVPGQMTSAKIARPQQVSSGQTTITRASARTQAMEEMMRAKQHPSEGQQ